MIDPYDDEDELSVALYDDGHWEWDENTQSLAFLSNNVTKNEVFEHIPVFFGPIAFRDDLDVVEQLRFKKRYQRKLGGDDDMVLLQDIKDLVIYTAPSSILSPTLIKIMHLSTTERFVRALILYSQYFVQVAEEMTRRIDEQEVKVRTSESYEIELTFRDNLEDLRILVAKEYCTMLIGGSDFHAYHHMGALKNTTSLSNKDACQFEAILRICIQIVWIALGRKCFQQIECEIHRMFKSETFNLIEHKTPQKKMSPQERFVLLGRCIKKQTKLKTQSPLINEIFCHRWVDYRLFGFGTIQDSNLTYRQRYFEAVLTASESSFRRLKLTLGIVGLPRAQFDTMLREIKLATRASSSCASIRNRMSRLSIKKSSPSVGRRTTSIRKSTLSMGKSIPSIGKSSSTVTRPPLYPAIIIPLKGTETEWQPKDFPHKSFHPKVCNRLQRRKWLDRVQRLHSKRISPRKDIKKI